MTNSSNAQIFTSEIPLNMKTPKSNEVVFLLEIIISSPLKKISLVKFF